MDVHLGNTSTPCPACKTGELLPRATDRRPDAWWCPSCSARFNLGEPLSTLATDKIALPFELRVDRDGMVLVDCASAERCSAAQLRQLAVSALLMAYAAERRQRHLRGGDRYCFRRGPADIDGGYYVRLDAHEAPLLPWTCGGRREGRAPLKCAACRAELQRGAIGYRVGGNWRAGVGADATTRFCAKCVEDAPHAEARRAFRVIDGGKVGAGV